jgi:hypothetical protein
MGMEKLIKSMEIFAKYAKGFGLVGAEHDLIFVYPTKKMTKSDILKVTELGWTQDPEGKHIDYDKSKPWFHQV